MASRFKFAGNVRPVGEIEDWRYVDSIQIVIVPHCFQVASKRGLTILDLNELKNVFHYACPFSLQQCCVVVFPH